MLSMPPETDAQAVLDAVREFAREEFVSHKYALVLHDPATDTDSHRPHVHLIVPARGRDGQRLNPRKADRARWRQTFADRLMERGAAASATRRQTRGILQPAKTLLDHHVGAIECKAWALNQGEAARQTENRALLAWKNIATALLKSEEIDDRTLGRETLRFIAGMQTVARRVLKQRQPLLFKEHAPATQVSTSRGEARLQSGESNQGSGNNASRAATRIEVRYGQTTDCTCGFPIPAAISRSRPQGDTAERQLCGIQSSGE
jgi:hypothetical protein